MRELLYDCIASLVLKSLMFILSSARLAVMIVNALKYEAIIYIVPAILYGVSTFGFLVGMIIESMIILDITDKIDRDRD